MNRFGWRQLLFIVPIIVAVLLLTNRQLEQLPQPEPKDVGQVESDYYLREVHITNMASNGTIEDELISELLTHYPHDDHSDLTAPRFRIHRANGEQLWAESRTGVIYGEERMVLKQAVRIEQRASNNRTTSRIESSEIEFERATKKVSSRVPVTITGDNYTIVAGAMTLLSNDKQLYLTEGVEGHYAP